MKLIKIFSHGKVKDSRLYYKLQQLDFKIFTGCGNEFKENREWWVMLNPYGNIIAYCGSWYSEGVCMFCRAWVNQYYRGRGIQRKMIKARLKAAKGYYIAITYTTIDNFTSANNLIRLKFKLYIPAYKYAGDNMIYFSRVP